MKTVNFFVGFTPFHNRFISKFVADTLGDRNYFLLTKGDASDLLVNPTCHLIGRFSGNKLIRPFLYIWSILVFSIKVNYYLFIKNKEFLINLYCPHPNNIFSNYLFFNRRVNCIHLYEDGLLNYCDIEAKRRGPLFLFFSFIFLLPYKNYSGHMLGCEVRYVDRMFASNPEAVVKKCRFGLIRPVSLRSNSYELKNDLILFLDQNTSSVVSPEIREKSLKEMKKTFPTDTYTYYYKGHHDFSSEYQYMKKLDRDLTKLPAEELMGLLRPGVVISFYSSALVNIARENKNVSCYSLIGDQVDIKIDGEASNFGNIFKRFNIRCF